MTWSREGIVSDADPVVLASRWFAETHADAAKRMSDGLRKATGGRGRAAPIPGGMMIPMNMWSSFYPEIGFGEGGWSQAAFYYYNTYWQPFTANLFWTSVARMGDRKRSVWVMPDCYYTDVFESYYVQNLWNLLAGGVHGLGYFRLAERKDASKKALRLAGDIAGRYGVYLNSLEPVRAQCVQVIPFENMISVPERWHQSVITWSNLILEGFDVDPAAADEDWETAQAAFLLNVRTLTQSSFEHLQRFRRRGGRVFIDAASSRFFPHEGMTVLPDDVARFENSDFDSCRIGGYIDDKSLRPVESQARGVFARRFVDSLGNRVCWFVDTVGGDLWRQFHTSTRGGASGDARLEKQGGYDSPFVAKVLVREKTGSVAWDVFGKRELPFEKGELSLDMRRWGARLVAFLPESPKVFDVSLPRSVGSGVPFDIIVETSGKCVVPFSVSAVDPAGNVSEEYRGRMLSGARGCVKMPFAFAVNDLKGDWTFRISNEFTGETKTGVVRAE